MRFIRRISGGLVVVLLAGACTAGVSIADPTATPGATLDATTVPPSATGGQASAPPTTTPATATAGPEYPPDPLLAVTLTDVHSATTFTLAELAAVEPVLLEPMAAWCSNCRAQQHEVKRAHDIGSFTSVSLDVDLTETPEVLAAYAEREGFDWRFAMADADLYRLLQERFGIAATNPPSTPLIVIETDGTVRPLEFGRGTRSAEQLIAEVFEG